MPYLERCDFAQLPVSKPTVAKSLFAALFLPLTGRLAGAAAARRAGGGECRLVGAWPRKGSWSRKTAVLLCNVGASSSSCCDTSSYASPCGLSSRACLVDEGCVKDHTFFGSLPVWAVMLEEIFGYDALPAAEQVDAALAAVLEKSGRGPGRALLARLRSLDATQNAVQAPAATSGSCGVCGRPATTRLIETPRVGEQLAQTGRSCLGAADVASPGTFLVVFAAMTQTARRKANQLEGRLALVQGERDRLQAQRQPANPLSLSSTAFSAQVDTLRQRVHDSDEALAEAVRNNEALRQQMEVQRLDAQTANEQDLKLCREMFQQRMDSQAGHHQAEEVDLRSRIRGLEEQPSPKFWASRQISEKP
eukprot:s279_g9.t2